MSKPYRRTLPNEYESLPLRAHEYLVGIPINDVWMLDLPTEKRGLSLQQIGEIIGFAGSGQPRLETGAVSKFLFDFRNWLGKIFGWDAPDPQWEARWSYLPRVTEEDRARSLLPLGMQAGIMKVMYQFEHEFCGEIINRTVQAFVVTASNEMQLPEGHGYRLYTAIYVRKISWITPVYMALITPFRHTLIYPSMMRAMRKRWDERKDA